MLDINTCIISCIVFNDLVTDLYLYDTDTWDYCDMHYLDYMIFLDWPCDLSCDLVFLWSCDYVIRQLLVQNISCSLYFMSQHACTVLLYIIYYLDYSCYCYYFQFSILPSIFFLCPTYCYYIFIFSLLSFFSFVYSC